VDGKPCSDPMEILERVSAKIGTSGRTRSFHAALMAPCPTDWPAEAVRTARREGASLSTFVQLDLG
jgi:hypothetical protein